MGESENIINDLCDKASRDVSSRVHMTVQLLSDPGDMFVVALSAAATVLGLSTGFMIELIKSQGDRPEAGEVADGIWEILRPMVVKAAGGGDADFRALLRRVEEHRA